MLTTLLFPSKPSSSGTDRFIEWDARGPTRGMADGMIRTQAVGLLELASRNGKFWLVRWYYLGGLCVDASNANSKTPS